MELGTVKDHGFDSHNREHRERLDAVAEVLPSHFFRYSSHLFGLAEAIATA